MRRLAATVHVQDPETGRHVVFLKGSEPPERVAKLITNPNVWDGEPEEETESESTETVGGEPPRSGKGSGRDIWAAFAAEHGVHVEDEDSRDDIIAALAEAGVITE